MNAVLGYIPGEVTIRRLLALLKDANRIFDISMNGTPGESTTLRRNQLNSGTLTSPPMFPQRSSATRPVSEIYEQLSEAGRHLAKVSTLLDLLSFFLSYSQ